jgi:Resolvase, N terminal domain
VKGRTAVTAGHLGRGVIIHKRVSTGKQVLTSTGSQFQQMDMRQRLMSLGWRDEQIIDEDRNLGHSGAYGQDRVGWDAMIQQFFTGEFGAIAVPEQSQAARSSIDNQRLIDACLLNDVLIITESGVWDVSKIGDSMMVRMLAVFSRTRP